MIYKRTLVCSTPQLVARRLLLSLTCLQMTGFRVGAGPSRRRRRRRRRHVGFIKRSAASE